MPATRKQKVLRDERTGVPLREVRLLVPDARHPEVQARLKAARLAMNMDDEAEAIDFIEAVSDYEAEGLLRSE